jgi:hypothetical protein
MRLIICLSALCALASATANDADTKNFTAVKAAAAKEKYETKKGGAFAEKTHSPELKQDSIGIYVYKETKSGALDAAPYTSEYNYESADKDGKNKKMHKLFVTHEEKDKKWTATVVTHSSAVTGAGFDVETWEPVKKDDAKDGEIFQYQKKIQASDDGKGKANSVVEAHTDVYVTLHLVGGGWFWYIVFACIALLVILVVGFMMMGGSDPEDSGDEEAPKAKKDADKDGKDGK